MYLVDEQHIVRFKIGEYRRQIARALEHRAGGMAQIHPHLARDDVRQRGLAQARRPEQQHVIQRLFAPPRGLNKNRQLPTNFFLADVFVELLGAQRAFEHLLLHGGRGGGYQAVGFDGHVAAMIGYAGLIANARMNASGVTMAHCRKVNPCKSLSPVTR